MKIAVLGHTGRMGKLIVAEIASRAGMGVTFAGGAGRGGEVELLFDDADVLIDFTMPEATATHTWLAAKKHKALVIGTTGLNETQHREIADAAKDAPILYAANMSLGVNLLLGLVEQAAARLGPDYDIEIMESHHRHKIDAPSGTALALGRAAQAGRKAGNFAHDRAGKRNPGDIGFAVQRGGDVVGEHDVTFFGPGERVMLSHKATDRALFARGAVTAAQWLHGKKAGLYSMKDVLGL
jgi:4-hydroxy-tetrahydrodipicolinate reductase